jgi:5-methylthioadenosine/S-adenosylhomocysteine deaminase
MASEILLEGAFVLTLDTADTAGWLSVAVQGESIAAIDEPEILLRRFPGAERIDCAGRLLMPGLVNAHLHPELHLLKGAVEELNLHAWEDAVHFDRALVLLSSAEGRWIQRAGIRASLTDCLLSGTTQIATYGVTVGADEVAARELRALRLRGHVTVRDMAFAPVSPLPPDVVPRIYRLHAEEALTPAELEAAARAHTRGERLIMHAAETEERIQWVREKFGTSTVRLLERYGLLSPRVLLSHAIYVDDEERVLLARRGTPIISSPIAETKLADGIAPIVDYLGLGITVALGTDCAVCNNGNDLFLEMRQLGLVQKLRYGADAMPAEQILRIATQGGTRALTGAADGGALVVGGAADLILIDLANPRLQPLVHRDGFSNVAANLVYAATGQDVTDVMIAGSWVVQRRRLLIADQESIWEDLARAADALYDRIL